MNKIIFVYLFLNLMNFCNFINAAPKNIVFMLSDDQSWSGLSVSMNPSYKKKNFLDETPNLEKLASEGTRFSNAYAPSPALIRIHENSLRISLQCFASDPRATRIFS